MELKLADFEDRNRRCNRRCNIRVIGLKEGIEGANAIQFLSRSLPQLFPSLSSTSIEIMRAHRIYNNSATRRGETRTLIFNVLRYTTRQAILRAAKKEPLSVDGRRLLSALHQTLVITQ